MRSVRELAEVVDPLRKRAEGLVRRMIVTVAGARAIWQVSGFRQLNGTTEARDVEVFSGIGMFARPPAGTSPEAIVLMIGDAKTAVAIAVRDEKTRAAIAGALEEDETALFNSKSLVHLKDDGTIEARSKNGVAVPLATKADLDALKDAIDQQSSAGAGFGSALFAALTALNWPTGTTKLKGE